MGHKGSKVQFIFEVIEETACSNASGLFSAPPPMTVRLTMVHDRGSFQPLENILIIDQLNRLEWRILGIECTMAGNGGSSEGGGQQDPGEPLRFYHSSVNSNGLVLRYGAEKKHCNTLSLGAEDARALGDAIVAVLRKDGDDDSDSDE